MKIPNPTLIGGHKYTTAVICGDSRFTRPADVCTWTKNIRINTADGHPESAQAEAYLHELIEVIVHDNELKLNHYKISILSEQLFAIIRNNDLDFGAEKD